MDEPTLLAFIDEALARSELYASKSPRVLQALFLEIERRWFQADLALTGLGYWPLVMFETKPDAQLPACIVRFHALEQRMDAIGHRLSPEARAELDGKEVQRGVTYRAQYESRFGVPTSHAQALPAPPSPPAVSDDARREREQNDVVEADASDLDDEDDPDSIAHLAISL